MKKLHIVYIIFLFIVLSVPAKADADARIETSPGNRINKVTGTGNLYIGKNITGINNSIYLWQGNITKVSVSKENKYFISKDGILYNKKMTKLLYYPSYKKGSSFKVPGTVKIINCYAFLNNRYLKNVVLNSGLKEARDSAFEKSNIRSVNIPSSVKSLGANCFSGCIKLKTVDNHAKLQEIKTGTFKNCPCLEKLNLGSSVISIYDSFYNCGAMFYVGDKNKYYKTKNGVLYTKNMRELVKFPGLKKGKYNIPEKVISIGETAFQNCKNLKCLTINENIKEFRFSWLNGCTSLETLNLPKSLEYVGTIQRGENIYTPDGTYNFVYGLINLKNINIPEGNKHFKIYGKALYSSGYRILWLVPFAGKSLNIHKNTEIIANKWCENRYTRITVPEENKYFTSYKGVLYDKNTESLEMFPGMLAKYEIPASLKDARNLINYVIHRQDYIYYVPGITYAEGYYNAAANLKSITVEAGSKYFKAKDGVLYNYNMTELYAYPHAKEGAYKMPATVTSMQPGAFAGAKKLAQITFSSNMEDIAVYIAGCTSLEKIIFKEGTKVIYLYGGMEPEEYGYTIPGGGINVKNIYFPSTLYDITVNGINKTAIFHVYAKTGKYSREYGNDDYSLHNITSTKDYITANGYSCKIRNIAPV